MSKMTSRKNDETSKDVVTEFSALDTSDFPDFSVYQKTLERALWILWAAKEKLRMKKLKAEQIASIIRDVKEISVDTKAIVNALNRAGDKIHTYHEYGNIWFEIMKPGKDYLLTQAEGSVELYYFEPYKKFSSKRQLSKDILVNLEGDLKIIDPYCNERTLDVLKGVKNRKVEFLTKIQNLQDSDRNRFMRELKDFKSEHSNVEFRSYPNVDIHDRYIISSDSLVILGHSIKDLGSKESFAIVMRKEKSQNIVEALVENFNRRWKISTTL